MKKRYLFALLIVFNFYSSCSTSDNYDNTNESSGSIGGNGSSEGEEGEGSSEGNDLPCSIDLPDADYNVLFVGNSLTYVNFLPDLVKDKAAEIGITINTHMHARGNYALIDHWEDGEVQDLINSCEFDFVVVQQGPSSQPYGFQLLMQSGADFAAICNENGAELAFYMVWPSLTYFHTFDGVIANYTTAASANNAILCPVGTYWKAYIDETGDYSYYDFDGFHPTYLGSLVAAEVIVDSLFN